MSQNFSYIHPTDGWVVIKHLNKSSWTSGPGYYDINYTTNQNEASVFGEGGDVIPVPGIYKDLLKKLDFHCLKMFVKLETTRTVILVKEEK